MSYERWGECPLIKPILQFRVSYIYLMNKYMHKLIGHIIVYYNMDEDNLIKKS